MNLLILFENSIDPLRGGVERVYSNLVPFFLENGIYTYAYYFDECKYEKPHCYSGVFKGENNMNLSNVKKELLFLLDKWEIKVVICAYPSSVLMNAVESMQGVMVFHHVHNDPCQLFDSSQLHFFKNHHINNKLSAILSHIYMHYKYAKHFRKADKNGHKVVLLSENFRPKFKKLFPMKDENIVSVPNPVVIDKLQDAKLLHKENILLYVGRLSEYQKNVSSLLRIWGNLYRRLPDYKLIIVGDGVDKAVYEKMSDEMKLENIEFKGYQTPSQYYIQSRSLLMVSRFEGFGMVLVEAMQYGCIPFAYNSYESLSDIIDDGVNGFMISPFDEKEYAEKLFAFLKLPDTEKFKYSNAAMKKAKSFDVSVVGCQWLNLFNVIK